MAIKVSRVDVWSTEIPDRAGGLAKALEPFSESGVNLECVIARRQPEKGDTGLVFVAPIRGKPAEEAARSAGFRATATVPSLRIEGEDSPGLGHRIASAIAEAGVNMRGVSATTLGGKFVGYIGFHSSQEMERAEKALKKLA